LPFESAAAGFRMVSAAVLPMSVAVLPMMSASPTA